MQQKCGMLINNVNNVKRWFYEKNYEYFIVDSYVNFIDIKSYRNRLALGHSLNMKAINVA